MPAGSVSGVARNPFQVLGLPARMDLSRATIERAYLARAAGVHPDARRAEAAGEVVGAPGETAEDASSELNAARRTLGDPLLRAEALLALVGGPDAAGGAGSKSLPPGFLVEFMPVREEAEEAIAAGDAGSVERLRAWAKGEREAYVRRVGGLFASEPVPAGEIRTTLNAWRYIERLLERLAGAELGPGA